MIAALPRTNIEGMQLASSTGKTAKQEKWMLHSRATFLVSSAHTLRTKYQQEEEYSMQRPRGDTCLLYVTARQISRRDQQLLWQLGGAFEASPLQ